MTLIDLHSPRGNAFALMALARDAFGERGHSPQECAALVDDLFGALSYAALLDMIDARLPGAFAFQHDPRQMGE